MTTEELRKKLDAEYLALNAEGRERFAQFTFVSSKKLASIEDGKKEVYEVVFRLPSQHSLLYDIREGDTVMLKLPNPKEFIDRLAACSQISGVESVYETLRREVRLDPISHEFIQLIADRSESKIRMTAEEHAVQAQYDIVGFLSLFPDVTVSAREIIETHPQLGRRTYDISSYNKEERTISLTVVVNIPNEFHALFGEDKDIFPEGVQKYEYGFSSHALAHGLSEGNVVEGHIKRYVYALPERFFPDAESSPLIIIAAGVAVGQAFYLLDERLKQKEEGATVGEAILIFGGQYYPDMCLYQEKIKYYVKKGVLNCAYFAASREKGEVIRESDHFVVYPSAYVGDVLMKNKEEIWNYIEKGAYIFVNGPKAVAEGVEHALAHVAHIAGGCDHDAAHQWTKDQYDAMRYFKIAKHVPRLSQDQRP